MAHISEFDAPPVIGETASGITRGTTHGGRRHYETRWSGLYEGVKPSEWTGEPMHTFGPGIIGETPQGCFAIPVSHFAVGINYAPAEVREQDARDFPHDEPCPNCGRRQWAIGPWVADPMNPTDEEQETCGACGRVFYGDADA